MTDFDVIRDALVLLGKFGKQPSLWPDGPEMFHAADTNALAALSRVEQELAETERMREENFAYLQEANGRVAELEAEREEAILKNLNWRDRRVAAEAARDNARVARESALIRAEAAEAEAAKLREALEQIATAKNGCGDLARSALKAGS